MVTRSRLYAWLFWLGIILFIVNIPTGNSFTPVGVLLLVFMTGPYILQKYRAGLEAAHSEPNPDPEDA